MAILNTKEGGLIEDDGNEVKIGVAMSSNPKSRSADIYAASSDGCRLYNKVVDLPNNRIWLTNMPMSVLGLGNEYLKNNLYTGVDLTMLADELTRTSPEPAGLRVKAETLYSILRGLEKTKEAPFLKDSPSLRHAAAKMIPLQSVHSDWNNITDKKMLEYWRGSAATSRESLFLLSVPRFDLIAQVIRCPIPDFSDTPEVIEGDIKMGEFKQIVDGTGGFAKITIGEISDDVADFVSKDSRIRTTDEVLWLAEHAEITVNKVWIGKNRIPHPLLEIFKTEIKPYSWLDGLRAKAYYFAPAYQRTQRTALSAWLYSTQHLGNAFLALYLAKVHGFGVLGLSNKVVTVSTMQQNYEYLKQLGLDHGFRVIRKR